MNEEPPGRKTRGLSLSCWLQSRVKQWPDPMPGAWSAAEYLAHQRRVVPCGAGDDLRSVCDEWTIGGNAGADPVEPLHNRGRLSFGWSSEVWSSIESDLMGEVRRWAEDRDASADADLAGYAASVHLELCAREEPPQGTSPHAIVLPLVISARQKADWTAFMRYLVGWIPRAARGDWNQPEMVYQAAMAVSLCDSSKPDMLASLTLCRRFLNDTALAGSGGFRSHVQSRDHDYWREVAEAAPTEGRAWAMEFMR